MYIYNMYILLIIVLFVAELTNNSLKVTNDEYACENLEVTYIFSVFFTFLISLQTT